MTIDETEKIDFTTVNKETGELCLVVIDHLPWEASENSSEHSWKLQEKLNAYLRFLESGEVYENFPAARGKKISVRVVGKFPLNSDGKKFYQNARTVMESAGFPLEFEFFREI